MGNEPDSKNIRSGSIDKKQVINATIWKAIELIVGFSFRFILKLILARLLLPEEFGLVGMAVIFTGLVETINELGFSAALIQRKDKDLGEIHYNTAFWTTAFFSLISFIVLAALVGPAAAAFYKEKLMLKLVPVLSIPILLKPLTLIHRVKFTKNINFKSLVIIGSIGLSVGGVAGIIMALFGFGVWSIAFQGTISSLVTIPLMWTVNPWRPKRSFSKQAFRDIFNFGAFVLIKDIMTYFVGNVDYLIIGKLMGSYYLGVYTLAFTLTDIFRKQLMGVLNAVMFPIYSKLQSEIEVAGRYYLKIVRYNTLLIYPVMTGMFIFADPFISIVFGSKWIEAIVPLKLLSLAVMFHVASGSLSAVLTGIGKVKIDLLSYMIKTFIITVPGLVIFINFYGINGAAFAILLSKALSFLINNVIARKYVLINILDMYKTIFPALFGSLAIYGFFCVTSAFIKKPTNIWHLFIYGLISIIVYFIAVYPFAKAEISDMLRLIKKRKQFS